MFQAVQSFLIYPEFIRLCRRSLEAKPIFSYVIVKNRNPEEKYNFVKNNLLGLKKDPSIIMEFTFSFTQII